MVETSTPIPFAACFCVNCAFTRAALNEICNLLFSSFLWLQYNPV
nr:MAG TPA: hypothetical protein [Caudoviricetes sp.]